MAFPKHARGVFNVPPYARIVNLLYISHNQGCPFRGLAPPGQRYLFFPRHNLCEGEFEYLYLPIKLTDAHLAGVLPAGGETSRPVFIPRPPSGLREIQIGRLAPEHTFESCCQGIVKVLRARVILSTPSTAVTFTSETLSDNLYIPRNRVTYFYHRYSRAYFDCLLRQSNNLSLPSHHFLDNFNLWFAWSVETHV